MFNYFGSYLENKIIIISIRYRVEWSLVGRKAECYTSCA